jgi:Transposase, Mutator family
VRDGHRVSNPRYIGRTFQQYLSTPAMDPLLEQVASREPGEIESGVASAMTRKSTRRYALIASERLRRELLDLIAGVGDEHDPIEAIGRLGARLILQQALEEELSEFLGRERYERRSEPVAYRNGYERVRVKTTAGPLELERPRVRNASALGFGSEILGKGVCRTHALEALVVVPSCVASRCATSRGRWREALDEPVVSKSTVSPICTETRERYRACREGRLDEHDLVYLFLDAVVRHEALLDRVRWKASLPGCRSSPVKLRAA